MTAEVNVDRMDLSSYVTEFHRNFAIFIWFATYMKSFWN